MKQPYSAIRTLRTLALATAVLCSAGAAAQTAVLHDPRDPLAYGTGGASKATGTLPLLLSTVHYVTRADTLSQYDSSRITYDASGQRVTELLNFRWSSNQWIASDRYRYTYNSNGLNNVTEYDAWNITKKTFLPVVRYNYTHDAGGNRVRLLYEVWNMVAAAYRNGLQEFYTPDAGGHRTSILQQTWEPVPATWSNNTMETMTYNFQGMEGTYLIESWDSANATWMARRRNVTSYDPSGLTPVRFEEFVWNNTTLAWVGKTRITNTVAAGKIGTRVIENFNATFLTWTPVSKETMSYNTGGELGSSSMADWNVPAAAFQDRNRSTYTYTTDHQPKRVLTLVPAHGKWIVGDGAGQTVYYYKGETVTEEPLDAGLLASPTPALRLAPVPASSSLQLLAPGFPQGSYAMRISDMSGRMLINREIPLRSATPTTIDVQELPAGTYHLSLGSSRQASVSAVFSVVR